MGDVGETFHGHPGSIDANPRRRAPKFNEPSGERFTAREHERGGLEQAAQPVVVARFFIAQHDVHTMEGNQGRLRPMAHEGEQVDSRVTEVDMEELGITSAQDAFQLVVLSTIEDGFQALDVFPLKPRQEVNPRAG